MIFYRALSIWGAFSICLVHGCALPIRPPVLRHRPLHNMTTKSYIACFLAVAVLTPTALPVNTSAQAWVQPAGGYYVKFGVSYLFTDEELNFEGDRQPFLSSQLSVTEAWFRDVSYTGYVEYGLTDNFTLVATAPVKVLTTRATESAGPGLPSRRATRQNGGLADLWLSVRTPVVREPFVLSVQTGVKVPLGYDERPELDGERLPPLGTSHADGELSIFAGKSLHPWPAYVSGGIGYRKRGGSLRDELPYNLEAGYTAGPMFFKLRLDGVKNTHSPPDLSSPVNNAVVGDQDWLKLSPAISYNIVGGFSADFEVFHVLMGKNTLAGTTYSLAVVLAR